MKNSSVLLLGSYGQTNLGDDLLLLNYINYLTCNGVQEIIVNASRIDLVPKAITARFPDVRFFQTYGTSPFALLKLLVSADAVVYGGGTVYKELYSSTGRSRYGVITRVMFFNLLARALGKPIYNLNIGTGSIKSPVGRFITKISLAASTRTTMRDQESYRFALDTLRLPTSKVVRSVDGLFINSEWQGVWHRTEFRKPKGRFNKIIGVNVLSDIPDWVDRSKYIESIQTFLLGLLNDGNYLVLVPFQADFNIHNDKAFMRESILSALNAHKNVSLLDSVPIDEVNSLFRQLNVFIGMRFHSLLLATANGVPFLNIAYDTKCSRFLEEIGYSYGIQIEQASAAALTAKYEDLMRNTAEIRRRLAQVSQAYFAKAEKDLRDEI